MAEAGGLLSRLEYQGRMGAVMTSSEQRPERPSRPATWASGTSTGDRAGFTPPDPRPQRYRSWSGNKALFPHQPAGPQSAARVMFLGRQQVQP